MIALDLMEENRILKEKQKIATEALKAIAWRNTEKEKDMNASDFAFDALVRVGEVGK